MTTHCQVGCSQRESLAASSHTAQPRCNGLQDVWWQPACQTRPHACREHQRTSPHKHLCLPLYTVLDLCVAEVDGLRYYDTEEGRGKEIKAGDTVVVSACPCLCT